MTTSALNPLVRKVISEVIDISRRAGNLGVIGDQETNALKHQVFDGFDRGNVYPALTKLLELAPNRTSRGAIEQLIDSALFSLGVDPQRARVNWQDAFTKLAGGTTPIGKADDLRTSPVRDTFRGLTMQLEPQTLHHVKRLSLMQARLEAGLKVALESPDKLDALRKYQRSIDLEHASDSVLMGLIEGYREVEAWKDLISLWGEAPLSFKRYPLAQQELARALAMDGQEGRAMLLLEAVVQEQGSSPELLGLLGRMGKIRYDRALEQNKSAVAENCLDSAIMYYRKAYRGNLSELYPAVALPVLLETAGDPDSLREAQKIGHDVLLNAARRSSFGERHYWDAATALEMSAVIRDWPTAKVWLERTTTWDSESWMRRSTLQNLERLRDVRSGRGEDVTELGRIVEALEKRSTLVLSPSVRQETRKDVLPAMHPVRGSASAASFDPEATFRTNERRGLAELLAVSYRFGGKTAKWLAGNYKYEGIAHDVRVTPADVIYFDRVMKAAGLHLIKSPFQASKAMDELIRGHYSTAKMENISGEEHRRFDRVMPGLKRLMAATRDNSQTNVSADWINRLGDCRQHAPAKLLLWEAWKKHQVNALLEQLATPKPGASPETQAHYAELLQKRLWSLNSYEIRILDAEIVNAESGEKLEEHTMTLLLKRRTPDNATEEMTDLDAVHLADSFYQNVHALGSGRVTPTVRDGKLWIDVPGRSEDGTKIALRPAVYSFDRAVPSFDFGQLQFRGVQVASPGWENDVPETGVDLDYLHDYAFETEAALHAEVANSVLSFKDAD